MADSSPPSDALCSLCGHPWTWHPDRTCTQTLNELPQGCTECRALSWFLERTVVYPDG